MRISDLWAVKILDERHREKSANRALIAEGKGLGVTIQGKYQPEDVVDEVRPTMLAILDAEIGAIEHQLRDLGVDMTPATSGQDGD